MLSILIDNEIFPVDKLWLLFGIPLVILLAFYLLRSIGVYKLAVNKGLKNAFLAFIPFAWIYVVGKLFTRAYIFGKKIKNFAVFLLLTFSIITALSLAFDFIRYFPLIGYFFEGGNVYFDLTDGTTAISAVPYLLDSNFYTEFMINVGYAYDNNFLRILDYFYYVLEIAELFKFLVLIIMYSGLFRKYIPSHYVIWTVLSALGLFPIAVFVIRNRKEVDFKEFYRAKMGVPYGENPDYSGNKSASFDSEPQDDPFADFGKDGGKKEDGKKKDYPDEPFSDF